MQPRELHARTTDAGTQGRQRTTPDASPGSQAAAPVATASTVDPVAALLALDGSHSTSLGSPGRGRIEGAVGLPDTAPGLLHNPRRPAEARYGSVELVQAIVRAAAVVNEALPGSTLVVNDIGLEHGGPIHQHGSHQNGRDADILFYALDADGKPMPAVGVPLDPTGKGWDFKDLAVADDDVRVRLDAPRTWRFVQALVEAAPEQIQRIFIVEHVRSMLLAAAKKAHAPAPVVDRFALVSCQPGAPHDDHMHVRFYCTPEDIARGCEDMPPTYPWRRQALAALDLKPILAKPRTRQEREARDARTTTPAQARAKAEKRPMDRKVRAFLRERRAWLSQPHPGRPFCR